MPTKIRKSILLVEDEAIIAIAQKMELERYDYSVVIAQSGESAISTLADTPGIDLILMDINLGNGLDGPETAMRILKLEEIPIVFLSSHTEQEVVEKTEKITAYGYVVKNSGITILDASIKMAFKLFEANARIGESESRHRTMIAHISDVICVLGRDGIVQYVSPNILKLFGWSPRDFAGMDGMSLVHPADLPRIYAAFLSFARVDEAAGSAEFGFACGDGAYKPVEITAVNLCDDPVIKGILLNFHDISERRKSEELVSSSEIRYRRLFETTQDGILILDAGSGMIMDVNPSLMELLGYSHDSLLHKTVWDIGFFKDIIANKEKFTELLKDKYVRYENLPLETAAGKIIEVEFVSTVYEYDDEKVVQCNIRNVTGRKLIDKLALQVRLNYESFFDRMDDIVFVLGESGNVIHANATAIDRLGYAREELLGRSILKAYSPERHAEARAILDEIMIGATDSCAIPMVTKNGQRIPIDCRVSRGLWDGEPAVFVLCKDLSELKLSEEKFSRLFSIDPSACALSDPDFNTYLEVNEAFCSLFGFREDEVIGHSAVELGIFSAETRKAILSGADSGGNILKAEAELTSKGGERKQVLLSATDVDVQSRRYRYTVIQDITDRKISEGKISSLLAEKELILKEVHHRIKNNMNTIDGMLALQADTLEDPVAIAALEDAGSRVRSMMVLYSKLYQSADCDGLSMDAYLPALADEILANFPNAASIRVDKDIARFPVDVKTLQALAIIINELLTNIMKYAFAGRESGRISIRASETGGRATVAVSDDGVGMPASVDFGNATGFGLSLVSMLVAQLHGSIRIERGAGTTIILEFALRDD